TRRETATGCAGSRTRRPSPARRARFRRAQGPCRTSGRTAPRIRGRTRRLRRAAAWHRRARGALRPARAYRRWDPRPPPKPRAPRTGAWRSRCRIPSPELVWAARARAANPPALPDRSAGTADTAARALRIAAANPRAPMVYNSPPMKQHTGDELRKLREKTLRGGAEKYHQKNAAEGKLFCRDRLKLLF